MCQQFSAQGLDSKWALTSLRQWPPTLSPEKGERVGHRACYFSAGLWRDFLETGRHLEMCIVYRRGREIRNRRLRFHEDGRCGLRGGSLLVRVLVGGRLVVLLLLVAEPAEGETA